jgi:hypothetical protein
VLKQQTATPKRREPLYRARLERFKDFWFRYTAFWTDPIQIDSTNGRVKEGKV